MKRILFTAALAVAVMALPSLNAKAQDTKTNSNDDDGNTYENFPDNPGLWSALVRVDRVDIQFGGHHWSSSADFLLSELGTLPTDKQGSFTVKRDAGTVTFNGTFDGRRGHGTYAFEADPAFKSYLSQEGFPTVNESLMIHLFFTNINKAYFAFMKEKGYTGISMSELKHLAEENMNQRVMTNYIELFERDNYGKVSLEKIIQLRDHGVSVAFLTKMHDMGYGNIPLDKAVELVDHGVSPQFVEDMKKIKGGDVSLDEAVRLVDHGVSVSFVKSLTDMGYTNISLDKAVELVDHGVSAEFIKGFKELGFKDISLSKATELVDHGVSVEFVKRMQDKGLKNMSLDEYIRLRDGGM